MPHLTTNLKVLLSSPGDVKEERDNFTKIIDSVNEALSESESNIRLEAVMWEKDAYPSLGLGGPQTVVNQQIGVDQCDIFLGILWTRFGTPTEVAGSGTEEEFNIAFLRIIDDPNQLRILFYFRDPATFDGEIDEDQFERVVKFKEKTQTQGLIWNYDGVEQFNEAVKTHLLRHARDFGKEWGFETQPDSAGKLEMSSESEFGAASDEPDFVRIKSDDSIKVFPSKKVYGRLNVEEDDWRKEFTVRYPIIEGITNDSILYKLNSALSYENVFEVSLDESIDGDKWLDNLDYNIDLLKKPFLAMTFHMDGIGMYPWHQSQPVVVNFETGHRLKAADFLKEAAFPRLVSIVNEFVKLDLKGVDLKFLYYDEIPLQAQPLQPASGEEDRDDLISERYGHTNFTEDELDNFSIDEFGATFFHDFGFPHVLKYFEPPGRYYFEYSSLVQLMKEDSSLAKFFRRNVGL